MVEKKKQKSRNVYEETGILVRILGRDIPGDKKIYVALTRIKGVSWGIANAVCVKMEIDKNKKLGDLSKGEVKEIEANLKNLDIASYLKNREGDLDSGEDKHLAGVNIEMAREFDIKRLKKIKSYRGNRHAFKLPVRGQRTRSHFRGKGKAVGVKKPKTGKKS